MKKVTLSEVYESLKTQLSEKFQMLFVYDSDGEMLHIFFDGDSLMHVKQCKEVDFKTGFGFDCTKGVVKNDSLFDEVVFKIITSVTKKFQQ